ncbi:MFS transporter [Bacillus cihuensis]|uniref:MFS transporter n=1 Tax=Bacillus cihuensis TaxID=1208599 RepID=UPI0003FDE475|nr:MFS transporter [Bacillus cihuensis]
MDKALVIPCPQGKDKIWTRDFIILCIANFFIFLGFQMTLPTIPLFVEYLGGNDQIIGIVVGIFTFSALIVRPYAGQNLETKGRKLVFLFGLSIFVVTVGAFGYMASIFMLFALRVAQGIGWGFSSTASGTIASDIIPASRRGEGMGFYGLSGNLALAIGPSLGLVLAGKLSFQTLFLLCGALGLGSVALATAIRYKKGDKPAVKTTSRTFDIYEKTALQPSTLLFFITVTFGGIATFLPLYSMKQGVTGIQWYFLIYAIALLFTRLYAGKLYDTRGHKFIYIPSALCIFIAMLLLAWLPNNIVLYTAAIFYGLGFGTVQPALQAWSIEKAAQHRKGMANATFFSFFDLGVGIGAITFGQIGYLFGYRSIYLTSALSIFISMIIYLYFLKKNERSLV